MKKTFAVLVTLLLSASLAWSQAQLINGSRVIAGWINAGTTAGTPPAYTLTLSPPMPGYVPFQCYLASIHAANTGAATLNVNGLGAKTIKKWSGGALVDLVTNDLVIGVLASFCYDGTNMQYDPPVGNIAPTTVGHLIKDETTALTARPTLTFLGTPVTCADNPGANATECTFTSAGHAIKDETTALTARPTLTFLGAGITCVDNAGNSATECTVTGTGTGLPGAAGTGIIVQNSMTPTTINRTLTVDASQLTIANANGVAGDPLISIKAGAVLTNPVISSVNAQTGTTYTMLASDAWKLVTFASASPVAVTLPQATTAGFTSGTVFPLRNLGPATVLLTPTTSTIDGGASLTLAANDSVFIYSNGANYVTQRIGPPLGFTAVPTTRQVNAHPLSSDVTVTKADLGLDQVDNTSDATKNSASAILTNKQVVPRVLQLSAASGTVSAPNADNADIYYRYDISGALTIPNPTATGSNPVHGQVLTFMLKCSAPQTISWGANFTSENGIGLMTSCTGDGTTYDQTSFRYNSVSLKWGALASSKAARGVTALSSSTTFACNVDQSSVCEMQMTGATGTITFSSPTGTPFNGQQVRFRLLCTNSQTLSWNSIFIASPNVPLPTTCPAGTSSWTMQGFEYSTVLSKYQLLATN